MKKFRTVCHWYYGKMLHRTFPRGYFFDDTHSLRTLSQVAAYNNYRIYVDDRTITIEITEYRGFLTHIMQTVFTVNNAKRVAARFQSMVGIQERLRDIAYARLEN